MEASVEEERVLEVQVLWDILYRVFQQSFLSDVLVAVASLDLTWGETKAKVISSNAKIT